MNTRSYKGLRRSVCLGFLLVPLVTSAHADGIPEPSLVLYGVVRNADLDFIPVTYGDLTWQFQRISDGQIVTATTTLTNVNDQFSFVLFVPCETEIPSLPLSTNTLRLGSTYTRAMVFLNGTNQCTLADTNQGTLILTPTTRGAMQQIDLNVILPFSDLDDNSLADDWERWYFRNTGVNPNDDEDQDGHSNYDEFRSGTNPTNSQSLFKFIHITRSRTNSIVQWSSATNRSYVVERSLTLTNFTEIATGLPATPPVNSFTDNTAAGATPYFYRIRLENER